MCRTFLIVIFHILEILEFGAGNERVALVSGIVGCGGSGNREDVGLGVLKGVSLGRDEGMGGG
jgi:hypothetical protein